MLGKGELGLQASSADRLAAICAEREKTLWAVFVLRPAIASSCRKGLFFDTAELIGPH